MSLIAGFAALYFFYKGLKSVSASMTSILELTFPIASVAISWVFLDNPLTSLQIYASIVLLGSIVAISLSPNK